MKSSSIPSVFSCLVIYLLANTISASDGGNETDYQALLQFKSMITNDPNEALSTWNSSFHHCDWSGVSCGKLHRRVTALLLNSTGLEGWLSPHVGNLSFLRYFSLRNNSFQGTIPHELGRLSRLSFLKLSRNKFNGVIPTNLSRCSNLEELHLGYNSLVGSIPEEISFLSKLTYFAVTDNKLTGGIPPVLGNITSMLVFAAGRNPLGGSIPDTVGNWKSLRGFYAYSCNLSGTIPQELGRLSGLRNLDLANNELNNIIPTNLSGCSNLEELHLGGNKLVGSIPKEISFLSKLTIFVVAYNKLTGGIPPVLGNITSMQVFSVAENPLGGSIPDTLGCWESLTRLYLGSLPSALGSLLPHLEILLLGDNQLTGPLPPSISNCSQLEGLILNGNRLQGEVPISLSKCRSLKVLDLGNNQLTGTFPRWLSDLPDLQVLVLKSNKLHGPIETHSTNKSAFPSMVVIVLSHNEFSGLLPRKYLENFSAMKNRTKDSTTPSYLDMGGIYYSGTTIVKGVELEFPKILVDYIIVDLSNNKFEGEIPGVIGSLTSLIVLDLSHNSLTGHIPNDLGNLSEIESLDLSWNQLTGHIPQRLSDLTFLQFLNLSQNHLVGHIPAGRQFNTFEGDSFGGNPQLCGLPLPKKCGPPQETQPEVDEDGDGFTWRVVMLGYGCGTLIGLVMGYVMLSTGRPKWFNPIADAGEHMIRTKGNKEKISIYWQMSSASDWYVFHMPVISPKCAEPLTLFLYQFSATGKELMGAFGTFALCNC